MLDIGWEEMLTCTARILAFGEGRIATSKSRFCKLFVKRRCEQSVCTCRIGGAATSGRQLCDGFRGSCGRNRWGRLRGKRSKLPLFIGRGEGRGRRGNEAERLGRMPVKVNDAEQFSNSAPERVQSPRARSRIFIMVRFTLLNIGGANVLRGACHRTSVFSIK
jgi:hypothetical protein